MPTRHTMNGIKDFSLTLLLLPSVAFAQDADAPRHVRAGLLDDVPPATRDVRLAAREEPAPKRGAVYSAETLPANGWLPYAGGKAVDFAPPVAKEPAKSEVKKPETPVEKPAPVVSPTPPPAPTPEKPVVVAAPAQVVAAPVVAPEKPEEKHFSHDAFLDAIAGGKRKLLDLSSEKPEGEIRFAVSAGEIPEQAVLILASNNLGVAAKNDGEVIVRVNGLAVARLPLGDGMPDGTQDITLPEGTIREGENTLAFTLAMRATGAYSGTPLAQIDLRRSKLSLEGTPAPAPATLRRLDAWLAPRPGEAFPIHIAIPQSTPLSDSLLTAGALASQGVVQRLSGSRWEITYSARLRRDRLNVLIGSVDQIAPYLPEDAPMPPVDAPALSVSHLPGYPETPMLVISGPDNESAVIAASAYAAGEFPMPGSPATVVTEPRDYPPTRGVRNDTDGPVGFFLSHARLHDSDGSDLRVQFTDGDPRTIVAAWDFLAQTTRRVGHGFPKLRASFNAPANGDARLIVGLLPQFSEKLAAKLPVKFGDGRVYYAHAIDGTLVREPRSSGLLADLGRGLSGEDASRTEISGRTASLGFGTPKDRFSAATLMVADGAAPGSAATMVLAATDAGALRDAVAHLQTMPKARFDVAVNLAVWNADSEMPTVVERPLVRPDSRSAGVVTSEGLFGIEALRGVTPVALVGAMVVLIVIVIIAIIATATLRRISRRRDEEEDRS